MRAFATTPILSARLATLFACAVCLLVTVHGAAWAQPVVVEAVKVRFNRSATDRRLIDKGADLVFDEDARRLIVKSDDRPLNVAYDDIREFLAPVLWVLAWTVHRRLTDFVPEPARN